VPVGSSSSSVSIAAIKSKMSALAAATSPDSTNSDQDTAGAITLSEIKNAVAVQADVDVDSITTEVSKPEETVREVEKEEGEYDNNSGQSNKKVRADSGAKDQDNKLNIGGIIGAAAGSLALFGVAGIALWIYRNKARERRKPPSSNSFDKPGHGYQNSVNPLELNEQGIELAVAMHDSPIHDNYELKMNKMYNSKIAVGLKIPALPPPPPPPGTLTRKIQVALYDFEANGDGQVSIRVGDTLIPTEYSEDNADWTTGTNTRTGEVGFYPTQYVKDKL